MKVGKKAREAIQLVGRNVELTAEPDKALLGKEPFLGLEGGQGGKPGGGGEEGLR